jgi:hypothetical protein
MNATFRIAAILTAISLAACAPSARETADAPAGGDSPDARTTSGAAAVKEKPELVADEAPDVDPVTGLNRSVTYEPQVGPEPQERNRKDARKTAPK